MDRRIHRISSVSEQLRPYSSPNPTITLTCYQGRDRCTVAQILTLTDPIFLFPLYSENLEPTEQCSWTINICLIFQQWTFHQGFRTSFWVSQLISSTLLKGATDAIQESTFPCQAFNPRVQKFPISLTKHAFSEILM